MSLNDFIYVDDQDDAMAAHVNRNTESTLRGELGEALAITAQLVLTDGDFPYLKITPDAAYDVLMPPEASTNHLHVLENASGTYSLTVKDDSDTTTLVVLGPGEIGLMIPSLGTGWSVFSPGGAFATSAEVLTGTEAAKAVSPDTLNDVVKRIPKSGEMLNGKLSVTVSASDLIVAIKTLAGADPSAGDPVYVNINGTVRTITAATSCTLADGTNWFNLGSTQFATIQQQLFAYAVWDSNSSVVAIAPARISDGRLVSDFSSTNTNEKYLGNYANYTSTDDVCVIGRFAATLSGGAGYTWTIPSATNRTVISEPIFETDWLTWDPDPQGFSAVPTTPFYRYRVTLAGVSIRWRNDNSGTSNSTSFSGTLPFTANALGDNYALARIVDNGSALSAAGRARIALSSNTLAFSTTWGGAAFTASSGKGAHCDMSYAI